MTLLVLVAVVHLWACNGLTAEELVIECVLPDEQSDTLKGVWPVTPVPLVFHAGDFSTAEKAKARSAAGTWNNFLAQTSGVTQFVFGLNGSGDTTAERRPVGLCAQTLLNFEEFERPVVIYKDSSWPYDPEAIALTTLCRFSTEDLKEMYMALMEINFENFFVEGTRQPDLETIFAHEFGHLAGLGHSCEFSNKEGTPNCNDPAINPDFLDALMFPAFAFPNNIKGEIRRSIRTNDQGRVNCLYDLN